MKTPIIRIFPIVLLLLILLADRSALLAADKPDPAQMKKDMKIMSAILDKIMNPDTDRFPGEQNTRAIYLEGQGVLFLFREKLSLSHFIISDNGAEFMAQKYAIDALRTRRDANQTGKNIDIRKEEKIIVTKPDPAAPNAADKLNERKSKLGEFLGQYCGSMRELAPTDQVTVILLSENSAIFKLNQYMTFQQQPDATQLLATVKFADILAARRDGISPEAFFQRIQFSQEPTGALVDKDLQIMNNIFSVALQQNREAELVVANDISSIYLQNFGALFVLNFQRNFKTKFLQAQDDYENLLSVISEEEEHFEKKGKVLIEDLKTNVIEVLADYGHNLKQLKNEEWIGVSVDLNQISRTESEPTALFIKVRKNDAIAVNQTKIDRNEFKKRVIITSF